MAETVYDLAIIGAGPGGYVAAIKAAQLNKKVILIEKDKLGGVCLNRGCIPTKALLKSAHAIHELSEMKELGIDVTLNGLDGKVAVQRANDIASRVSKGVEFLMKKNKITTLFGEAKLKDKKTIEIKTTEAVQEIHCENIIIATGAKYKTFPGLKHDGDRLIGAWDALKLEDLPKSIGIIGAGAIGIEFAYFWNAFGVDVHIFEIQPHLLPLEDEESSKEIERAYKKLGIKFSIAVEKVEAKNSGNCASVLTQEKGEAKEYSFDKVLIAVGMTGNIENLGLEDIGIKTDRGFIIVNERMKTSVENIYAIGDVSGPPLLAHVASHEGLIAVEDMGGLNPHPLKKENVAGCTYCQPQVASVGETEQSLKEKGIEYTVGKMPFRANGKAVASNEISGHVKVLIDKDGKLLGGHLVSAVATELIHELALFKSMNGNADDLIGTIHPHPTLGEWIAEAMMAAKSQPLHG